MPFKILLIHKDFFKCSGDYVLQWEHRREVVFPFRNLLGISYISYSLIFFQRTFLLIPNLFAASILFPLASFNALMIICFSIVLILDWSVIVFTAEPAS